MPTKVSIAIAGVTAAVLFAAPASAQKGSAGAQISPQSITANPELVFETIPSCRAFDTHATQPLIGARSFIISGADSLKKQGGPKAGCGIPASATAVAISLATSDGTEAGFIAGYPRSSPVSNAVAAYGPGGPAVSGATIALNLKQITLAASVGAVQVSGDVTGYYAPQIQGFVNSDGSVYASSPRLLSVTHTSTGEYSLMFDREAVDCATLVTPGAPGATATASTQSGGVLLVHIVSTATDQPADGYFNFHVAC